MNNETDILKLADYSKLFKQNDASAYLIINKNIKEHPCMFGFAELSRDFNTNQKLFEQIEQHAKELGYEEIIGPLNHDTWMNYRWAIDNFDTKLLPDCNNPNYYVDHIKKLGYDELYTYRSAMIKINNPLFELGKQILKQKESELYTFRHFQNEECIDLIEDIYKISCDAFSGTELYSDIPFEYFKALYASKMASIDGLNIFMAYSPTQEAIGYVLGYPSPDKKMFVSKTSAVLKSYQNQKIYTALLYLGLKYIKSQGYDETLFHFQCEQRKTFKRFSKIFESNEKRYAIFKKDL